MHAAAAAADSESAVVVLVCVFICIFIMVVVVVVVVVSCCMPADERMSRLTINNTYLHMNMYVHMCVLIT